MSVENKLSLPVTSGGTGVLRGTRAAQILTVVLAVAAVAFVLLAGSAIDTVGAADEGDFTVDADGNETNTTVEPNRIIGGDDRTWVSNTESMPYSSIIEINSGCTGAMVGEYHALTAAHCFHDEHGNTTSGFVAPGKTNASVDGYSYSKADIEDVVLYSEFAETYPSFQNIPTKWGYDIALLELDRNIGKFTGYMDIYNPSGPNDGIYTQDDLSTIGYPGDKRDGTMWSVTDTGTGTGGDIYYGGIHSYHLDTVDGQSGSPVFSDVSGTPTILSIHSHTMSITEDISLPLSDSKGARITQENYDDINRWRNQDTAPTDYPDLTSKPEFLNKNDDEKLSEPSLAGTHRPGSEISVSVPVRNVGTEEAGCFDVTLVINDNSGQQVPIPSSSEEVCSLSPFTTATVDLSGEIHSDIPVGSRQLIGWEVDSDDDVTEFGEVRDFDEAPHASNTQFILDDWGNWKFYNLLPAEPSNPSVSDGATGVSTSTTLSWSDSGSGVTYDVYLESGTESPSRLVSDGQSSTSYSPSLEEESTYSWKVVAKGPNGQEAQSPVWSFETTTDDSGPTAPSNPTPESSATGIATSTTLSWDASTYDEYFFYDIYFGTSSDPSYYASKDGTSVDVGGLQQGETYYWRVVANGGTQETSSPTWSFDTSSGSGDISIKNPQFRNEERDGPLAISGPYSLDEGYLEYTDKTTVDHDNEYDLRVINDRGIVVSTKEDEAYDGEDSATKLDMDDGEASIFRTPGTHSAEIILHAHRSGETYSTTKATEVEVQKSDNDMSVLPANPKVGETVSADVSHISQDSGETPIEGYEWTVIKNPDGDTEFVKEVSGPNKDEISFTPSEAAEYEIVASDSSNYNGYVIDDVDFQVRSSLPEPSLSVDGFSAPSTATAGETFSAEVDLTNSGDATANYIIRFKANGNIHEVEAANEDPQDSRTESGEFTLPAGTHDVEAVVIDSHNNKHAGPELTETVTVEENTQPDEPTITSPSDGASDLTRQPTLEWSASDPDGDTLTYDIRLEKGDRSPENTVQTGVTSSSLTPSQLDYGSTYYWQVVAKDEHGASNTGPVWQFTTEPEPNRPPTASVDATPSNPAVGEFVELDATGSSDPNGDPLDYDWTIQSSPEGTSPSLTSGNAITSFLASEPGIYEIELTVNDPSGLEDTVTATVGTTDKTPPTAEAGSDITTSEGNRVNFNGGLSSDNVGIVSYEWDFDDGDTAAGRTPSHVYPNPGEYTVELTVTDAAGNTDTDTLTVTVEENALPTASFEYSPSTPTVSDTVSFNASESNDPDGSIQSYEWDFGDGITATATGSKSSYSYDSSGNYTIELTVTDGNGATDTDRMNITVEEEPEDTVDDRRELGRGESEDADLDDRRDQSRSEDRDIDRRRGSGRGGERGGDRGQSR